MFTVAFWKAAAERAIKSFAQAGVVFLGTNATGLLDVDFGQGASVAGLVALLSILTSVASGARDGNPSLINAEVVNPPATPVEPVI